MENSKKALITGASEGIGRAFSKRLVQEGYTITAVARNESRLKELIQAQPGKGHTYLVADLATKAGVTRVATELKNTRYDLLINNAGFSVLGAFYKSSLEDQQKVMQVNMEALVALSHVFLQTAKSGDALINVSSVLALMPMPIQGVYSATKAFVTAFSESLWYEHKDRGVYVMGLCPGTTKTEFFERAGGSADQEPPETITQTPEEVVAVAMKALKKRKRPTVVSGPINVMFTAFPRFTSRKSIIKLMGKMR
ncbi:SDR family NAD(P)-dependent oxidoreductase [Deltaproteobacteria bacterium TL4]